MRLSSRGTWILAGLIVLAWLVLVVLSVRSGWTQTYPPETVVRGVLATIGLADPLGVRLRT